MCYCMRPGLCPGNAACQRRLASALRARTALSGVGPVEIARIVDRGETYYRVRVGPFIDAITAAATLSDVAEAGYRSAKIILQN